MTKLLKIFLLASIVMTTSSLHAQEAMTYRDYYQESITHYEQADFEAFLTAAATADSLRPNHPVLTYNLAAGYALTGQADQALQTLNERSRFYATADFTEDEDFIFIFDTNAYSALLEHIDSLNVPRQTALRAFALPGGPQHPEGIAWHQPSDRFLIGDIRSGRITSYDAQGGDPQPVIDLAQFGYGSAMGMHVDRYDPSILWVASSILPEFEGYREESQGVAWVLKVDLKEGQVIQAYSPHGEGNHVFGDLVQASDGTVYVSDSGDPGIYTISPGSTSMEMWMADNRWWNLQGVSASEDGRFLYAADYITGIFKIEIATRTATPLLDTNAVTRGSDGIYFKRGRLIFIQNGTTPKRVGTIRLDAEGDGIPSTLMFPDNALPALNEPTLGTFRGNIFHYIANSPWAYYDDERNPVLKDRPQVEVWRWGMIN